MNIVNANMNVNGMRHTKRIENEIYLGIGTDNTLGRALLYTMNDNQLEQCEYFE